MRPAPLPHPVSQFEGLKRFAREAMWFKSKQPKREVEYEKGRAQKARPSLLVLLAAINQLDCISSTTLWIWATQPRSAIQFRSSPGLSVAGSTWISKLTGVGAPAMAIVKLSPSL